MDLPTGYSISAFALRESLNTNGFFFFVRRTCSRYSISALTLRESFNTYRILFKVDGLLVFHLSPPPPKESLSTNGVLLFRWMCPYSTIYSGPTLLQLEVPTGYSISAPALRESLDTNPALASTQTYNNSIAFMFDYVSQYLQFKIS